MIFFFPQKRGKIEAYALLSRKKKKGLVVLCSSPLLPVANNRRVGLWKGAVVSRKVGLPFVAWDV